MPDGARKGDQGGSLVGLTRAFIYAGAPRVVASLWQVSDLATAELMKKFYRGMLRQHLPAAAALRAAQVEVSGSHMEVAVLLGWIRAPGRVALTPRNKSRRINTTR